MDEIVVGRCELRIRRTAGWSWGASPDALIAAATRAIPQLVASRLPTIASASNRAAPIHITQPVTVRIAATARQLAALADVTSARPDVVQLRERIESEVEVAVARAIELAGTPLVEIAPALEPDVVAEHVQSAVDPSALVAPDAPRRALRTWFRSGTLAAVLARLEPSALALLHDLVVGAEANDHTPDAAVLAIATRAHAQLGDVSVNRIDLLRHRIAIAAAIVDATPAVTTLQIRAAIDHVAPAEETAARVVPATPSVAVAPSSFTPFLGEVEIRSAVPFLLLSSLRHAGWFDTCSALLALHEREADAFALAAGIAAKVLDPIERGWARTPADRLAIAVFAGRAEPILDAQLVAAASRLAPLLGPLDAALRGVLAKARRPSPLVLWRDDRSWLLFDTDGMVAIAASTQLADVLAETFAAPILVPARFADPATLERIDYANRLFITDAAPSRGESWRAFSGLRGRLHTNDTSSHPGQLAATAAHFERWIELADELCPLLAERPAIPRDPLTAFDATCTLVATAALADIGARLFPAEPTTPVLAMTRFRDLDARVWFEPEQVRVRVPLGRRHAELMRHGVLGTFTAVPWFAGRAVDVGGG